MAYVGGPTSRLPGASLEFPKETVCDNHPERLAVKRIQGETDSFGYEAIDMCQECYDNYKKELETLDTSGTCDWCKKYANELIARRDFEEGLSGPVYDVCMECIRKENDMAAEDLDLYDRDY